MMPASSITQVCGRRPLPPHVSLNYLYLMAKQLGVIQYSGKMGNTVGRKKAGSARNIVSVKVDPSNPKTYKQAVQRAVFAAAKNFRNAFPDILNHSFQGVKYGQDSLNRFTKLATLRSGDDFPSWIPQKKGMQEIIPQPWPVSRGSVGAPTNVTVMATDISTPFIAADGATATTAGAGYEALLAACPYLKNGDMLTVLLIFATAALADNIEDNTFVPVYDRFIIDSASEAALDNTGILVSETGLLKFSLDDGLITMANNPSGVVYCGAAVIISRQNGDKASWLRSGSDMAVSASYLSKYHTANKVDEAINTFMATTGSASSDWYLNETGSNGGGSAAITVVSINNINVSALGVATDNRIAVATMSDGTKRAVSNGTYICFKDAVSGLQYYDVEGRRANSTNLATIQAVDADVTDYIVNTSATEADQPIINP